MFVRDKGSVKACVRGRVRDKLSVRIFLCMEMSCCVCFCSWACVCVQSFKLNVDSHCTLKDSLLEEGRQLLELITCHKSGSAPASCTFIINVYINILTFRIYKSSNNRFSAIAAAACSPFHIHSEHVWLN